MFGRLVIIALAFMLPFSLHAADMKESLNLAAKYFTSITGKIKSDNQLVIQVVNYQSKQKDTVATKIETELYFALEKNFPNFKLILLSESVTGLSYDKAIFIKGTYEPMGNITLLRLQATQGMSGQVVAQTQVKFDSKKKVRKTLVAVLDIKAEELNKPQKKAFSEIFRTFLSESNTFDMASSADIDKMNPDQIQKATGCTRDECATIIGEQLGVDRVISSSLFKISAKKYILSAKIMDIKDGSILVTKTVKHNKPIDDLDISLEILARKLTGKKEKLVAKAQPEPKVVQPAQPKVAKKSSNLIWHIAAITTTTLGVIMADDAAQKYNQLADENKKLSQQVENASTQEEYDSLKAKYDGNQAEMESKESDYQTFTLLTLAGLGWEGYLLFFGGEDTAASAFRLAPVIEHGQIKQALSYKISF